MTLPRLPLVLTHLCILLAAWYAAIPLSFDGRAIITVLVVLSALTHFYTPE